MKKRLFSLVLALTVAAGCLVGCGGSKSEKKADATNSSEAGGEKILRVASEDPQVPLDMQHYHEGDRQYYRVLAVNE